MKKLAVQLYTVRDFLTTRADLIASLQKISQIGYTAVQVSAVKAFETEVDAKELRKLLDDNGLRCIATHRSWDRLANNTEAEIELHHTLGCDYAAIGGLPGSYETDGLSGYQRFVSEAQPTVAALRAAGIDFGYHNHSHEFRREQNQSLFDVFIASDLALEIDLYWAWHAGVDPSQLIRRCSGRVPVIHLKDKEVVAKDGPVIAPIGEGNLPWTEIIAACEASGVQWYCIEQDTCRRDPFDCLKSSFNYLQQFGLF
jgi:sugar phosphate isomerase/epimerase